VQFPLGWNLDLSAVMRGHSRPKDGVASLAYDPRIHDEQPQGQPYEHCFVERHHGLPGQARQ
jgi:hypothetical protein